MCSIGIILFPGNRWKKGKYFEKIVWLRLIAPLTPPQMVANVRFPAAVLNMSLLCSALNGLQTQIVRK